MVADAVADGLIARSGAKTEGDDAAGIGSDEPLADWERDLLQGQEGDKVEQAAVSATGGDTATEETPAAEATGAAAEATEAKDVEEAATEAPAETPPRLRPRPPADTASRGRPRGRVRGRREEGGLSVAITAADVKKLRELTGAGMMDCKKALEEAEGDFDKAAELLRIKLGKKAAARGAEREATSGLVATSGGALVELKSETDFVAKNEEFVATAQKIADAAAEAKAGRHRGPQGGPARRQDRRRGRRGARHHHRREDRARPGRRTSTASPWSTCTSVRPTSRRRSACSSSTTAPTRTQLVAQRCRSPR